MRRSAVWGLVLLAACADGVVPTVDTGRTSTPERDAGRVVIGGADAAPPDGEAQARTDAGPTDAGPSDAGAADAAASPDASTPDAASPDATSPADAGARAQPDAGAAPNDQWIAQAPAGTPPPSFYGPGIYDPERDHAIFYPSPGALYILRNASGLDANGAPATPAWQRVPAANPPVDRAEATLAYDSLTDRLMYFGGRGASSNFYGDAYFMVDATMAATPGWLPSLTGPPGRGLHSFLFKTANDTAIVFGGFGVPAAGMVCSPDPTPCHLRTIWLLRGANGVPPRSWTEAMPVNSGPTGLAGHAAALNEGLDQMYVFGGSAPADKDELWRLAGATTPAPVWAKLTPSTVQPGLRPAPRRLAGMAIDQPGRRLFIYGGTDAANTAMNDLWLVEGASTASPRWCPITPMPDRASSRTPPAARFGPQGVVGYHPRSGRLLLIGGATPDGATPRREVWTAYVGQAACPP